MGLSRRQRRNRCWTPLPHATLQTVKSLQSSQPYNWTFHANKMFQNYENVQKDQISNIFEYFCSFSPLFLQLSSGTVKCMRRIDTNRLPTNNEQWFSCCNSINANKEEGALSTITIQWIDGTFIWSASID